MTPPVVLLDLGFAVGKLEPAEDGTPILTILNPADGQGPAQSAQVGGWDELVGLGTALLEYVRAHEPRRRFAAEAMAGDGEDLFPNG